MTDEEYICLKSLPVAGLPTLNENCRVDCLVILEGVWCLENLLNSTVHV
jgi:hypothetical protein